MSVEQVGMEGAMSTFRSVAARALAQALIDGIDNAAAEGRPLNLLQQVDLATMTVMTYADAVRQAEVGFGVQASLDAIRLGRTRR